MGISEYFRVNSIYCGDCQEVLRRFPDKYVDLIYADPPFFSNKRYEVIWGDGYEIHAFEDRWKGGIEHYIAWMEPKLRECNRILKDTGAMFLHCDWHANAHLRVLMDKIFGESNFRNEISVKRIRKNVKEFETVKRLNTAFDSILFYGKTDSHRIIPPMKADPRPARWHAFDASGLRTGMDYSLFGHRPPQGGHWRWTKERAEKAISEGKLRPNPSSGRPEYLIAASTHSLITSAWDDINAYSFKMKFPSEKSEELLLRIIDMSSHSPTDLILDPFCGCGTAIVTAQERGRKWIGIDVSPTACKFMAKRMRDLGTPIQEKDIIGLPRTLEELKVMEPFEFQNWVLQKLGGRVNQRKVGDMGIDGWLGEKPVQVKRWGHTVGRVEIDKFETAMRREKKKEGIVVAFEFGGKAHEEVARVKNAENGERARHGLRMIAEPIRTAKPNRGSNHASCNGREAHVDHPCKQQIRDHGPLRPDWMAWPHADYRPPEQHGHPKETGVLHLMPAWRAERQIVEPRCVPNYNSC